MISGCISVLQIDVTPAQLSKLFSPYSYTLSLSPLSKVPLAKNIYGLIGPNGGLGFAIGKLLVFRLCNTDQTQLSPLPSEKAMTDQVLLALGRNGGLLHDAYHGLPRGSSPHLCLRQCLCHS